MPSSEPSAFWHELGASHRADLDRHGFQAVKRHQALRYFTWRWTPANILRGEQTRFLLRHVRPTLWPAAWLGAETGDEAWAGLGWTRTEQHLCTFFTRLLWQYATAHGHRSVLDLDEPEIGSPLPVYSGGRLISQDLANCALETATIGTAVDFGAPQRFLEVGAGYGRTAYALLSLHPESTYTIIDIPPALDISRWYLEQLFDPGRLRFVNALEPYELNPVDVALSISSLQEMTPEQVAGYLKLFDRVAAHVYLKQWRTWTNPVDHVTMRFDEYPYPTSWNQESCRPAPVQTMFDEATWTVPRNVSRAPHS